MHYDYKAVGGPERGKRKRGCKTAADRVAAAMQDIIRAEASEGWEYVRTDLVPVEERESLLSRKRVIHCAVLIFRRPAEARTETRSQLSKKAARIFGAGRSRARDGEAEPALRRAPAVAAPRPEPEEAPAGPQLTSIDRAPGPPQPQSETQAPAARQAYREQPPTPEQLQAVTLATHPVFAAAQGYVAAPAPSGGEADATRAEDTPPEGGGREAPQTTGLFTRNRGPRRG